jgi:hypothetical protein
VFFFVEDNGGAMPDRVSIISSPNGDCPDPLARSGFAITGGDIQVTDAKLPPASEDQCKGGGWRSFGVFKNQGDCVSFVTTGGKNQPSAKAG